MSKKMVNKPVIEELKSHPAIIELYLRAEAIIFSDDEVQKEFETLTGLLKSPRRPFLAVVGGAKISTKIEVLKSLIAKADIIFIGGAMANTFLQAKGFDVEKSLTEPDLVNTAREIIELSKNKKVDLISKITRDR